MSLRHSKLLLAAIALVAAPAFAQDTAEPAEANPSKDAAGAVSKVLKPMADDAKAVVDDTKAAAEKAVGDAKDAATKAMTGDTEPSAAAADAEGTAESMDAAAPVETTSEEAAAPAAKSDAAAEESADMAPAAAAEETADEATTPGTEAAAAEAQPAAEPAATTGAPTSGEPQVGQPYIESEHGDWSIRCIKMEQGADPCALNQLLLDESNNPLAQVNFVPLMNDEIAAGGTFVAPLETDLIRGLGIQIDGGEVRGYPFSVCSAQDLCVSRVGFTSDELAQFKRGAKAIVSLLPFGEDPNKPIELTMSLSGFTAGFEALTKIVEEQAPADDKVAQ